LRSILLSITITVLSVTFLFASSAKEDAQFLGAENVFSTALEKAKSEKKMLVMVIVKEHCHWCEKLVKQTLADPEVKERLSNYVTVIVDRNDDFPKRFKEDIFPSIFYIDYVTGKSIYENVGFIGKKNFLNDLNQTLVSRNEFYH